MKIKKYLDDSPYYTIEIAHRRTAAATTESLKKHGVNFLQALLLAAIYFEKKGCSPSDLSRVFGISKVLISQNLKTLEELGYIEREIDPEDGRKIKIRTQKREGRNLEQIVNILHRLQDRTEKTLSLNKIKSLQKKISELTDLL